MNPIKENPFRVLGLFANCSEREIQKQVAALSAYARVGQSKGIDFDLAILGDISRSEETIKTAANRIEQSANKVDHALFWFVKTNHIDDTALNHLRAGDIQKAIEIWELPIKDKPIGKRNVAAALNLSTLQLAASFMNDKFDTVSFEKGIRQKGRVLSSDSFESFVKTIAGDNVKIDKDRTAKEFAEEILGYSDRYSDSNGSSLDRFVEAFSSFPEESRKYLNDKLIRGPINRVETEIEKTKNLRTEECTDAEIFGEDLYDNTINDLAVVESVLGPDHPQHQLLVNKVANEVLQCSIDFFNEFRGSEVIDPGDDALTLLNLARSLKPTGSIKHRIEENAPTIEEWVAEKPEREEEKKVRGDIEFITNELEGFQSFKDNPTTALRLLRSCQPKLLHMASVLGNEDGLYLKISDAVSGNAVGMTISAINAAQQRVSLTFQDVWDSRAALLRDYLDDASKVMALLTEFDMSAELRKRCEENGRVLVQIMGELGMRTVALHWQAPKSQPFAPPRSAPSQTSTAYKSRVEPAANMFQVATPRGFFQMAGRIIGKHKAAVFVGFTLLVLISLIIFPIGGSNTRVSNSNANTANPAISAPPGMVFVPGTTFTMGRANGASVAESPAHQVTVKSFYIDVYETTNAEYQKFMAATKHWPSPKLWGGKSYKVGQDKYPVVGVTQADADAYARWSGKRLPTEEEWELAARGTDGKVYPWGNEWKTGNANADPNYRDFSPVGNYPIKSPYGLFDMIGNAWEWTSSEFKPYPGGTIPKEFLGKANLKTIRGGSFSTPQMYATTTYRIGWQATGADNYDATGFRCAKDIAK